MTDNKGARFRDWPGDAEVNERIHDALVLALTQHELSLAVDGSLEQSFSTQVGNILLETHDQMKALSSGEPHVSLKYDLTPDFEETSRSHADQGRHPAEPLMAAEILFGVALPELALASLQRGEDVIALASALHHAIWRRFPPGAIAYVEYILGKLASAHRDERAVLARELHDRVAHRLAVGLQRIELAAADTSDEETASNHLAAALDELQESLVDLQDIANALRQRVGERSILDAITDYVARLPERPPIEVVSSGTEVRILSSVAEEAFTIVLEAIRNARRHAKDATFVRVDLTWEPATFVASVLDDGRGGVLKDAAPSSFGIVAMNERADVIGAKLEIVNRVPGTQVTLTLPLARVAIRP